VASPAGADPPRVRLAGSRRTAGNLACPCRRPRKPGVTSPDGRELQRLSCPACEYQVAVAIWCGEPACCEQDRARFTGSLLSAETARGIPVFAIRFLAPAPGARPHEQVDVWRAGIPGPVFTGPAAAAVEFQMRHHCPAG
jgi:hypothetical protein